MTPSWGGASLRRAGSPIVPVPTAPPSSFPQTGLEPSACAKIQVASYYCTDLVSPMNQAGRGKALGRAPASRNLHMFGAVAALELCLEHGPWPYKCWELSSSVPCMATCRLTKSVPGVGQVCLHLGFRPAGEALLGGGSVFQDQQTSVPHNDHCKCMLLWEEELLRCGVLSCLRLLL